MTIFSKFHANAQAELGLADRQQTPNAKVYPLKPSQNPYILHKAPRTWSSGLTLFCCTLHVRDRPAESMLLLKL
jgi:hypothetical protein